MTITRYEVEEFFTRYGTALTGRDPRAIAAYWGIPALVLSDEGAIAVAKAAEVEAFFASSMAQYEGVTTASARIKSAMPLSDDVISCEIGWGHEDATGQVVGGEGGHYLLRRDGGDLKIHVYTPRPE